MRQAYAHEAVLIMEPDADMRAPGAAVTVALCGTWDHEPPCPLAAHHVHAVQADGEVRLRILFATEPDTEQQVRYLIEHALTGRLTLPDESTTPWRLHGSRPSEITAAETEHAERLIRS